MWCPQSLAATRASAALPFDPIQYFRVNLGRGQSLNQVSQIASRIGWTIDVTQNDFRERIAGTPLQRSEQLVGWIVDGNGSAPSGTVHESDDSVNASLVVLSAKTAP